MNFQGTSKSIIIISWSSTNQIRHVFIVGDVMFIRSIIIQILYSVDIRVTTHLHPPTLPSSVPPWRPRSHSPPFQNRCPLTNPPNPHVSLLLTRLSGTSPSILCT